MIVSPVPLYNEFSAVADTANRRNVNSWGGPMSLVRPSISSMKGYVPGSQPDPGEGFIKLNSNENPFPPSPKVQNVLQNFPGGDLRLYPDPVSWELRAQLGEIYGFAPQQIICGNGSDDILNIVMRTFAQSGQAIGFYQPAFPLYRVLGIIHGAKVVSLPVAAPYDQPPPLPSTLKIFFLANPNSPVGFAYPPALVSQMAQSTRGIFVVDEAYAEFANENALDLVRNLENVIVVRTVSKSYSLAGVRLGYAIGNEKWIAEMFKVKDPFNVNRMTQALVTAALQDREYFQNNIRQLIETREWITKEAVALGYRLIPSQANFIFLQPPQKGRGVKFYETLLTRKVLTRFYDEEGLQDGVRMTIGTREEMAEVLRVLKGILPEFARR
jgi:histidinol-phosphate aminotransferase